MDFINIWKILLTNGASSRKEEGTARFWSTLSPAEQQAAFTNISTKLAQGRFVHYDPIQAIRENIRAYQQPQPLFLRGDEPGDIVQVRYNGAYRLCSRATMERFGLEWVRDWQIIVHFGDIFIAGSAWQNLRPFRPDCIRT